jgi:hypothetical protein
MSVDLDVHIAWAEVQMQFAGDEDAGFKHTSSSDTQSADNTVVAGQKVEAKIDYDPVLTLSNISWASPRGGNFVKDYITTNNAGTIVSHATSDYYAEQFEFYYTSKNSLAPWIGETTIFTDPNGHSHTVTREATYYLETPTVNSFTSEWGEFSKPTAPISVITYDSNGNGAMQLGGVDGPLGNIRHVDGITWTANVTPTNYAGGEINFVQLVNAIFLRCKQDGTLISLNTPSGEYLLDTAFPYKEVSCSIEEELSSWDSPYTQLHSDDEFVIRYDQFQLYLIYKPDGQDSIWVTLSLMSWNWGGNAEKQNNGQWILVNDTGVHGGGISSYTSILPEWDDNIANYQNELE